MCPVPVQPNADIPIEPADRPRLTWAVYDPMSFADLTVSLPEALAPNSA